MSNTFQYSIGDEVVFELYIQSLDGEGKEGETPTISVKNLENNFYLDFDTNIFSSGSGGGLKKSYLIDIGEGFYQKSWDSSLAVSGSMKLAAIYEVASGSYKGKDIDYLFFSDFESKISTIKQIECGRWKIENNQMVFYNEDGITPLLTFDLKDVLGNPSIVSVFERVPSGSV